MILRKQVSQKTLSDISRDVARLPTGFAKEVLAKMVQAMRMPEGEFMYGGKVCTHRLAEAQGLMEKTYVALFRRAIEQLRGIAPESAEALQQMIPNAPLKRIIAEVCSSATVWKR